ncbi:hypothetical protein XELAEV_18047604mg [Xenopus laevis]|uniref:Uncharacterized protein n=1 Tax=Xenopus laevis TaxID=8355 RepID=A0A974BW45_XENLA|nr:hypothetical protein XELAEV_18047604mg [Xenopus laevis]
MSFFHVYISHTACCIQLPPIYTLHFTCERDIGISVLSAGNVHTNYSACESGQVAPFLKINFCLLGLPC